MKKRPDEPRKSMCLPRQMVLEGWRSAIFGILVH
jgi:hypothetical protein